MDAAAIRTEHVTKRYGESLAVDDVSFEVDAGTIFGFVGPSGSGKTSIVRLLTGVQQPTSGSITVLGRTPSAFGEHERRLIGYLPQRPVLYPELSVAANVHFAAALYGLGGHDVRRRIHEVLVFVELEAHRRKRLAATSGGMQRRTALAAALVHDPALLFLDEPTAGLDPILRHKLWQHFRDLRDDGRTLFVTTQHVDEAAHCDVVGVMMQGRLLLVDTPAALRRRAMGGDVLRIRTAEPLSTNERGRLLSAPNVRDVRVVEPAGDVLDLVVDDQGTALVAIPEALAADGIALRSVEAHAAPFDEIFVRLVRQAAAEPA